MSSRKQDWPVLLSTFLVERKDLPFTWGINDCCTFAAAAVEAMTDADHSIKWRRYKTLREAATLLAEAGGVGGVADAALGARIPVSFAQRGDVVMLSLDGRESLAICDGVIAFAPGLERMEAVPIREATCAWRV